MGDLSEHLSSWKFKCRCGCGLCIVDEELINNLGGFPIHVISGTRCFIHNKNVGGHPTSHHMPKWKNKDGNITYEMPSDIGTIDM